MKITFKGAVDAVTGSRTLVEYNQTLFLIDAGLYQGEKSKRILNWEPKIDVHSLAFIVLTHAHIDHSGLLPKLVKDGYKGPIYCSHGTKDLAELLLLDAAKLQDEDAKFANDNGYSNHKPALPLYTIEDAKAALALFESKNHDEWFSPRPDLSFRLTRSGHIIGSTFIEILYKKASGLCKITFSGDLGNGRSAIMKPPLTILESDYLVLESTYGDRLQSRLNSLDELAPIINTVIQRDGVVLIPAFAVGRAQEVLHALVQLKLEGKIDQKIPIYLDSPMANKATDIFLQHPEEHLGTLNFVGKFFPVSSGSESQVLQESSGAKIIISASGMLSGGRIMHHLKTRLPDKKNGIIFVGYQAESTKGRLLQNGLSELRIHHESFPVNAEIFTIDSLSAHADYLDIFEWLKHFQSPLKKIFLNHGEKVSRESLAQKLTELGYKVELPNLDQPIIL